MNAFDSVFVSSQEQNTVKPLLSGPQLNTKPSPEIEVLYFLL